MNEKETQKILQDDPLLLELLQAAKEVEDNPDAIKMAIQILKGTEKVQ